MRVKIDKLKYLGIGLVAVAIAAVPFILQKPAGAQQSAFHDFVDLNSVIDSDYAYGKMYYTENTKITVKKTGDLPPDSERASRGTTELGPMQDKYYFVRKNQDVIVLVEDSTAVDKYGNPVDVIISVKNYQVWDSYAGDSDAPFADVALASSVCGTDQALPTNQQCIDNSMPLGAPGDPIIIWTDIFYGSIDVSYQYIKKGTYNNGTGQPAGIDKIAYAMGDFDVPNNPATPEYSGEALEGNEGISLSFTPINDKTDFYYQKNDPAEGTKLEEYENGIAVTQRAEGASFNGIHYTNSLVGLVSNMENSTYSYRFSATGAGIFFFIGSPVAYDMPAPLKSTTCDDFAGILGCSANTAKPGDAIYYGIEQYVPENHSNEVDIMSFMSLWSTYPNIKEKHNLVELVITDEIDANLTFDEDYGVHITADNEDVSDKFIVLVDGSRIEVEAKPDALANDDFYGKKYSIIFKTVLGKTVATTNIQNFAKTAYSNFGIPTPKSKTSNEVDTTVVHTLTIKHVDELTGENLEEPHKENYVHGETYKTTPIADEDLPAKYQLTIRPENAEGKIVRDTEVIYTYNRFHTVTVKHLSKVNKTEIADPEKITVAHGAEYETSALKNPPEGYRLSIAPKNAKGKISDDVEVIYYYDIPELPKTLDIDIVPILLTLASTAAITGGLFYVVTRRR